MLDVFSQTAEPGAGYIVAQCDVADTNKGGIQKVIDISDIARQRYGFGRGNFPAAAIGVGLGVSDLKSILVRIFRTGII